eukprot:g45041.t1
MNFRDQRSPAARPACSGVNVKTKGIADAVNQEQRQKLLEKLGRSGSICEEKKIIRVNVSGPVTLSQCAEGWASTEKEAQQDGREGKKGNLETPNILRGVVKPNIQPLGTMGQQLAILRQLPLLLAMSRLIILAGDFNCIIDMDRQSRGTDSDVDSTSGFLMETVKVAKLHDIFSTLAIRAQHRYTRSWPDGSIHSRIRNNTQERLDQLLSLDELTKTLKNRIKLLEATAYQKDVNLRGVTVPGSGGLQVKASLYMDDSLDPLSIHRLMSICNQFDLGSGAKKFAKKNKFDHKFIGKWSACSILETLWEKERVDPVAWFIELTVKSHLAECLIARTFQQAPSYRLAGGEKGTTCENLHVCLNKELSPTERSKLAHSKVQDYVLRDTQKLGAAATKMQWGKTTVCGLSAEVKWGV